MNYKLLKRPEGETAKYAAEELLRCLSAMDASVCEGEGGIELSLVIRESDLNNDRIMISVKDGRGEIAASNEGALLIAVYRFLYELGCRWTHPGEGGEHIPVRSFEKDMPNVVLDETPSYKHRGVCIEGAVSEENALEMIEFLPRVGMNSYFIQFFRPTVFFQRWYEHWQSLTLPKKTLTAEDVDGIRDRLVGEIHRRGLRYHAVGHGWTCVPFGVAGDGWQKDEDENYPEEYLSAIAELDGERKPWNGVTLNTNLCYSQPVVRTKIAQAVVDYCREHSGISALHLWLADGSNNQCECPACRDTRPSDYYVMLLNEIDELMTAQGIDTKVVFLAYVDLLWAPERETIKNPDRFILMFAPITRTYSKTIRESVDEERDFTMLPFERNKLVFPRPVGQSVTYLREWQKNFSGDGFIFDYHLMWDHAKDVSYMEASRTLFDDMKNLDLIGLDGMISCQLSRSAFPTGLPIYGMARALWDKHADFDATADEYFTAEFGKDGADVRAYLEGIRERLLPDYIRHRIGTHDSHVAELASSVPAFVEEFCTSHPEIKEKATEPWRTLAVHAEYCVLLSRLVKASAEGASCEEVAKELHVYLSEHEMEVQHRMDLWNTMCVVVHAIRLSSKPFPENLD
ncbi:MAG: DUF4838 domain-containing protein [Ruminococcaceae bacterium]|nr:DUF4838 domain-containing protein [Oscillospiraceae bacterium]